MSYLSAKERLSLFAVDLAERALPSASGRRRQRERCRDALDALLRGLTDGKEPAFDGTVLIDGTWDNPNYWVRLSLLRAALGLRQGREVAYLGAYRRSDIARSCANLGIAEICSFERYPVERDAYQARLSDLLSQTCDPADVLDWALPEGFPASFLYDAILRQQRLPVVDIEGHRFASLADFGLRSIEVARAMLDHYQPALVAVSAVNNFRNAPLAWMAARRGIPTVAVHGQFGVPRFYRIRTMDDIHGRFDRPDRAQIDALAPERAAALQTLGHDYLAQRRAGRTSDLGAVKAYRERIAQVDVATIREAFCWSGDKPIVAVYAANWYDFPHAGGMGNFRDFADWQIMTAECARANDSAYWLFKPHPNEENYPGASLQEVLGDRIGGHLRFTGHEWNSAAVMCAVDGIVAFHGTVGIEAPALGTPVLLADRGWYHDCGFARWAETREDYARLLGTPWWRDTDTESAARRAEIFAGWFYGCPLWQGDFLLPEDTGKHAIYDGLPELLASHDDEIRREIATVRSWFESDAPHYHTTKMAAADSFQLSNVRP